MKNGPPRRIENAKPLGLCPCGQKIWADIFNGAIIHQIPYCEKFEKLDPLEFVKYVRMARGL